MLVPGNENQTHLPELRRSFVSPFEPRLPLLSIFQPTAPTNKTTIMMTGNKESNSITASGSLVFRQMTEKKMIAD